jgi:hypothetical protein
VRCPCLLALILPSGWFGCTDYKPINTDDATTIADGGSRRDGRAPTTDAGEEVDAAIRCDIMSPFGPLVRAPGPVNTDWYPSSAALTGDGLSMFITVHPGGIGPIQLMLTARSSQAAMWGAPTPLSSLLNFSSQNADPALSANGLTLYYSAGTSFFERQLYVASRVNPQTEFGNVAKLEKLASVGHNGRPTLRRDGAELCFQSTRLGGFDLLCAPIAAGLVGEPRLLAELNTAEALEACPVLSADGLALYFSSTRGPSMGQDIWLSTRPTLTEMWTKPVAITELNSAMDDQPIWLSDDRCTLYVNSTRDGKDALWVTIR